MDEPTSPLGQAMVQAAGQIRAFREAVEAILGPETCFISVQVKAGEDPAQVHSPGAVADGTGALDPPSWRRIAQFHAAWHRAGSPISDDDVAFAQGLLQALWRDV